MTTRLKELDRERQSKNFITTYCSFFPILQTVNCSSFSDYAISWIVAFCTKMDEPCLVTMFLNKLIHASAKKV